MLDKYNYFTPEETRWFCIHTKPKCEDLASINVAMKNITVFNPKIEEPHALFSKRLAPLFPGYVFAQFSLARDYYKILWTPGVKQLVGCGSQPIPVDDEVILLV